MGGVGGSGHSESSECPDPPTPPTPPIPVTNAVSLRIYNENNKKLEYHDLCCKNLTKQQILKVSAVCCYSMILYYVNFFFTIITFPRVLSYLLPFLPIPSCRYYRGVHKTLLTLPLIKNRFCTTR